MPTRPDIAEQRRKNLKLIVAENGGSPSTVAAAIGLSGPSFISQMTSGKRNISENTARKLEAAYHKPAYWMDQPHSSTTSFQSHDPHAGDGARVVNVDPSFIGASVQAVVEIQQELNAQISPEKYADIVDLVYRHSQAQGVIDRDFARRLIKLTL